MRPTPKNITITITENNLRKLIEVAHEQAPDSRTAASELIIAGILYFLLDCDASNEDILKEMWLYTKDARDIYNSIKKEFEGAFN